MNMANLIIVCLTAIALYGMKLYAQRGGKAAPAAAHAAHVNRTVHVQGCIAGDVAAGATVNIHIAQDTASPVNRTVHVQGDNNGIAGDVAAGATVNIHIAQAAAAR